MNRINLFPKQLLLTLLTILLFLTHFPILWSNTLPQTVIYVNNFIEPSDTLAHNSDGDTLNFARKTADCTGVTIDFTAVATKDYICLPNSGEITVSNISGGVAPYEFSLDGVDYDNINPIESNAGAQTVYVRDANGCVGTKSVTVNDASYPLVLQSVTPPPCPGTITLIPQNGASLFKYNAIGIAPLVYSSYNETGVFKNLKIGDYNITVTDGNGCTATTVQTVTADIFLPTPITATISSSPPPLTACYKKITLTFGINTFTGGINSFVSGNVTSLVASCKKYIAKWRKKGDDTVIETTNLTTSDGACQIYTTAFNELGTHIAATYQAEIIEILEDGSEGCSFLTDEYALDTEQPIATCKTTPIDVFLDANGEAKEMAATLIQSATDNCSVIYYPIEFTFTCSDIITPPSITITVKDAAGNEANDKCQPVINVIDNIPPVARCKTNTIVVPLTYDVINQEVIATLTAAQVDDGSTDNCSIKSLTIDFETFTCSDIGIKDIILTVTDVSDLTETCTAQIEVVDNIAPDANCQAMPIFNLDVKNPMPAIITESIVNDNSIFNCTTEWSLDKYEFYCSGPVTLKLKDALNNESSCSTTITVNIEKPTVTPAPTSKLFVCAGESTGKIVVDVYDPSVLSGFTFLISKDGGITYQASPTNNNEFDNLPEGDYFIKIKTSDNCISPASEIVIIEERPNPTLDILSVTGFDCNGGMMGKIEVQGAGGTGMLSYCLDDNPFGETRSFEGLEEGKYKITVKDDLGCKTSVEVEAPTPIAPPAITATEMSCTTDDDKILSGATVNLSASGTGTFTWDNILGAGATKTVNPSVSTTYNVTLTDANGCTATAFKTISVISGTTTAITATESSCTTDDDKILSGASVNLSASGTGTFAWDNALGAGAIKTVNPSVSTTYNVTLTDVNGCTATASKTISVVSGSSTSITATESSCTADDDKILSGATVNLSASGAGTFVWDNALGAGAIKTVNPSVSTTYNVTLTDVNGCTATASKTISVVSGSSTAITATESSCTADDDKILSGATVNLSASGAGSFVWDNALGAGAIKTVNPSVSTTYNVTLTDVNGCTATASKTISVVSGSSTSITATESSCTADDDKILSGATVNLSASGAGTFVWDNALGAGAIKTVSPSVSTTYNVTLTDVNGCTATAFKTISVVSGSSTSITATESSCTANDDKILSGATVNLSASGAGTFVWDNALGAGAIKTVNPSVSTTYNVTLTDINGCTATASKTISVITNTNVSITNLNSAYCKSAPAVTLTGSPTGGAFTIDGNAATSLDPATLSAGSHNVVFSFSDANGCFNSASQSVTINPLPILTINSQQNIDCFNDKGSIIISASGGLGSYQYSINGTDYQTSGSFMGLSLGMKTAYAKDDNGCIGTKDFTITTVIDVTPPTAVCQDINVNLNAAGSVSITAAQINNGSSDNCSIKSLNIDKTAFNCTNTGINNVILTVTDAADLTATCTAKVTVVDVTPPTAVCQDITVNLNAAGSVSITATQINNGSSDNCSIKSLNIDKSTFNCSNTDINDVILTVTDASDLTATCTAKVTVIDITPPTAVCQDITVNLNAAGSVSITAAQINNGSTDNCSIKSLAIDKTTFNCANTGINDVILTVTDASDLTATCTAKVTVVDITPPTAVCQDITVNLNVAGSVSITAAQINNGSSDNCSIKSLNIDKTAFNCANTGINDVILTVTDAADLTATCTAKVTVVDVTPPTAVCKDITVNLNAAGSASITANQINNGSSDNCSIKSLNIDKTAFNCANTGINDVILTVTDAADLTATCTAKVTVVDVTPPTAVCKDITVNLNAAGSASITANQINNGSSDNCSIKSLNIDKTTFNCANTGINNVILTVTDASNLTATCTAKVTVVDVTPPTAVCKDITVNLNAAGSASITAAQINNGSSDNCSIKSLNIDKSAFNCANTGINNVILTVTDASDLTATCTAKVTVVEVTPPTAVCQDITVNLNAAGSISITAAQINNGSSDNCSIKSLNIDKTAFNCTNTGINDVILTITDASDLTATCTAKVTVVDVTPPTAVCQDITVNLNAAGSVSITAAQTNNGSSDNCSIKSLNIDKTAFNCANTGINNVILTVTDASDLTANCTAKVTVVDVTPPTAVCQDITVNLNAAGSISITAAQINNGSSDNCSIKSLNIDKSTFNCANTGINNVILTVTDASDLTATCTAKVTVVDVTPPTSVCQDITVNLNAAGSVSITAAQINNGSSDNCSIKSLVIDKSSFNCSNTGINNVILTVTDASDLTATCTAKVTVIDITPPTAVCQDITVNLSAAGSASITAAQINNGSTDNCSVKSILFDDDTNNKTFNCNNLGINNVILKVTDVFNLTSTCIAKVTVKDITPPTITCPANISVQLPTGECVASVQYSLPTATDNCSVSITQIDNTGKNSGSVYRIGTYLMQYRATDGSGNSKDCQFTIGVSDYPTYGSITCKSSIKVKLGQNCVAGLSAYELLTGSRIGCYDRYNVSIQSPVFNTGNIVTADMLGQIIKVKVTDMDGSSCLSEVTVEDLTPPQLICPNDRAITCGQIDRTGIPSPKVSGEPQVFDECSPYTVKFRDEFLNFPCNTSLTTAPQGFPTDKFFNYTLAQNISRIIIRYFTVEDSFKNATLCKQIIYVKTSGIDDIIQPIDKSVGCTEGYYNTHPRDTVINGKVIKGTGYPYFRDGFPLDSAYCNFSSTYTDNKVYFTGNTDYYYIERTWFLRDYCRNINTTYVQKIVVYDAGISLRCKKDLSFNIQTNFSVDVQASQLVASVTTDCTPLSKIKYGIRKVGNGTGFPDISSITFICADTGFQNVEIWAKDLSGNTSLCVTQIKILASPNSCSQINQLSGIISTETLKPALANITLSPLNLTKPTTNGAYSFSNLQEGINYKVQPNRDDNPSNGVTTFDIALISRHILGITPLSSPYKIIAADVNRDGEVDGSDMLLIRRLVLRSITKFPNNTSWRFVPKQFVFANLDNPFNSDFPEVLVYNNLRTAINNADFTAIKVGDVNNSALPIPTATPMSRGLNNSLNINVLDKKLEAGKEYEISLKVKAEDKLTACQFALNIDKNRIDVLNIVKGDVKSFDESNYAFFKENELITTAWASPNAEKWDNYSILKLTLKARKTAYLSELLSLESQNTGGIAYDSEGNELAVKLNFENKITTNNPFELLQNKPNPFSDETIIPFYLPSDEMARLTIYDITGKVISDINRYFTKGYNEVIFKNKAANESGLLFYRLQTASQTGVQKMYFIKKP